MDKNKPLIIKLWKLLQILNIISAILYSLLFLIKKDLFYNAIEKLVSYGFPLFLIIILDILSVIIIIGLKKKAKFGYYTSLIFIFIIIISSLIDFVTLIKIDLSSSFWYLVQTLIFVITGYLFYKERKYFKI